MNEMDIFGLRLLPLYLTVLDIIFSQVFVVCVVEMPLMCSELAIRGLLRSVHARTQEAPYSDYDCDYRAAQPGFVVKWIRSSIKFIRVLYALKRRR